MSYTLKLDWDEDRLRVVRLALETFITTSLSPDVLGVVTGDQRDALVAGARQASAALADINLYADARDEILAQIRAETEAAQLMLASRSRQSIESR